MHHIPHRLTLLAAFVALCACADTSATAPDAPLDGPQASMLESGPPPEGLPADYYLPTSLTVAANAHWGNREELGGPPGNQQYVAKGFSNITFWGTMYTNEIKLSVSGTYNQSNAGGSGTTFGFPDWHSLSDSTEVVSTRNCGGIAQATAKASVWMTPPNGLTVGGIAKWGEKTTGATKSANQAACAMKAGTSTPGEGSSGDRCVYLQLEISFDQGLTWEPWGDPFWYCDENEWEPSMEQKRSRGGLGPRSAAQSLTRVSSAASKRATSSRPARVTILGTTTAPRVHVVVQRDPSNRSEALLLVDTARASAEDLEAALTAAASFVKENAANRRLGIAPQSTMSEAMRRRAAGRADALLRGLSRAAVRTIGSHQGRSLETTVTVQDPRR